jgi:hypothetical protein
MYLGRHPEGYFNERSTWNIPVDQGFIDYRLGKWNHCFIFYQFFYLLNKFELGPSVFLFILLSIKSRNEPEDEIFKFAETKLPFESMSVAEKIGIYFRIQGN